MKLLRTKEVVEVTRLSRMTIYRMEKAGTFPARRQLGARSVAWTETEVHEWIESRPKGNGYRSDIPKPLPVATRPRRLSRSAKASAIRAPNEQGSLPLEALAGADLQNDGHYRGS